MAIVGAAGGAVFVLAISLTLSNQKTVVPVSLLLPPALVSPAHTFDQTPIILVSLAVVGSMGDTTWVQPLLVAATVTAPNVIWEKSAGMSPYSKKPKSLLVGRVGEFVSKRRSNTRLVNCVPSRESPKLCCTANWLSPTHWARSNSTVAFNDPELALAFA